LYTLGGELNRPIDGDESGRQGLLLCGRLFVV
jgi:hypothetical protein